MGARGSDDKGDGVRGVRGNERLHATAMATVMEQEGESERQTETERRVRVRKRLIVRDCVI